MAEESRGGPANDYLICRSTETDEYSIWGFDIRPDQELLSLKKTGKFDRTHQMIPIGDYILEWGPIQLTDYAIDPKARGVSGVFPYRLFRFDPTIPGDPLAVNAMHVDSKSGNPSPTLVTKGIWNKSKFWWLVPDFGSPQGPGKEFMKADKLLLLPLGTFILFIIPTVGRGTFKLFQFDPGSTDPVTPFPTPDDKGVPLGSFGTIEFGHELIPLGNYVLDWLPRTRQYWLWSFDPMNETPLARPAVSEGHLDGIDESHQLIPIGEHVLDWDMAGGGYRLWLFDPTSDKPLTHVKHGEMPSGFNAWMSPDGVKGNILTGVQGLCPIDPNERGKPGTFGFMRSKIEHVVYFMVENRSFDHACGWLYEKGEDFNCVGHEGDFQGAEHAKALGCDYNVDKTTGEKVSLNKDGPDVTTVAGVDLYHDMTDTIRQCFFKNPNGYDERPKDGGFVKPDMGGFVWNNGNKLPMATCTPSQLPVLNRLARKFAVSDEWFCSMPGATDANRAFALTGSALGELNNFMSGPKYEDWPDLAHRASIWKVLWSNGFDNWKIYNSVLWGNVKKYRLTYQLYLENQIPSVDSAVANYLKGDAKTSKYLGTIDQFMDDAKNGTLPAFSFLEPIWIASEKGATSYHPLGQGGVGPAETSLNEIYEALKSGPKWHQTLLIITFDEHGGFFDHLAPPRAVNPWPHDKNDGFEYDLMGVRVPTILVSPWIEKHTVFRAPEPLDYKSPAPVAYDSTSILATLLHWYGIPKGRWALGRRVHQAPTFERVFKCEKARSDEPKCEPPQPLEEGRSRKTPSDLEKQHVARIVRAIVGDNLSRRERRQLTNEILGAEDVDTLAKRLSDVAARFGGWYQL